MKPKIKRSILLVLNACDGLPMPESALLNAVHMHSRPERSGDSDILDALHDLETQRYAMAVADELANERTWTLTAKGTHGARKARGA